APLCRAPLSSPRELDPRSENFRDAPCLSDTAARGERRLGIEHFADRADARLAQVRKEPLDCCSRALEVVRIDLQPRVDERTSEPGPYRSLVIRGVPRSQVAEVPRLEIRVVGRERTQADRRQQSVADDADDWLPSSLLEHRMRQRNGEDLIRPDLAVDA